MPLTANTTPSTVFLPQCLQTTCTHVASVLRNDYPHGYLGLGIIEPPIQLRKTAGETYQWQWKVIDHARYKKY